MARISDGFINLQKHQKMGHGFPHNFNKSDFRHIAKILNVGGTLTKCLEFRHSSNS